MSFKQPKAPVSPSDCCKVPSCRKMLCGMINAYYERMTGEAVIETEVGEEKHKFGNASPAQMRTLIFGLQEQCGDAQTAVFVNAMGGQYASHTPSSCRPAPRGQYGCC